MHTITAFLSWTCYGQWLHGDERGSVDDGHNQVDTPWLPPLRDRREAERERMSHPPYEMDDERRRIVLEAIREVCRHRGWELHAAHVRALHVHVVVTGAETPERMMNTFKSYASRALNAANIDEPGRKRWTRHGSTKYINDSRYLAAAVNYTLNKQGTPMARFPCGDNEPRP